MLIQKVDKGTDLADMLLAYVENCSWKDAKEHIAEIIRVWKFADWETMFAAIHDGKIVGMASAMKTDYIRCRISFHGCPAFLFPKNTVARKSTGS